MQAHNIQDQDINIEERAQKTGKSKKATDNEKLEISDDITQELREDEEELEDESILNNTINVSEYIEN